MTSLNRDIVTFLYPCGFAAFSNRDNKMNRLRAETTSPGGHGLPPYVIHGIKPSSLCKDNLSFLVPIGTTSTESQAREVLTTVNARGHK